MRRMLTCALAIGAAAIAVGAASATPTKTTSLCALGQLTTKAKPCTMNPAFGKDACKAFEPSVAAVAGAPVVAGSNRAEGFPYLSCYFAIGGQIQRFSFLVLKDFVPFRKQDQPVKQGYAATLADLQSATCPVNNAQSAPVILSGVGDAAFEFDLCPAGASIGISQVDVLRGTVLYQAQGTHPSSSASAAQLLAFVQGLMAKYH